MSTNVLAFLTFRNMWDNMSGFWRMQCADDSFDITAKVGLENSNFSLKHCHTLKIFQHYSLYLDPVEREKELKISWVRFIFV